MQKEAFSVMEYNVSQEARVWDRVLASDRAECPAPSADLTAFIRGELAAACTYERLATRVCAPAAEMLRCIAHEERCHAARLGAISFLMTGKKVCPERVEPDCITCAVETLRARYRKELADAESYEALAASGGEHADTYAAMAAEEHRHAQMLVCVIQRVL